MNTAPQHNSESNMTVFLLGAIFNIMAATEWSNIADYALKAFVGGVIWLVFKLIGDYISHKFIGKRKDEDRG